MISKDYILHSLWWKALIIDTIIFITITILISICVTAWFLVFPSKEDAKDDKNSQLPKCTIGNHNVYQCDFETLLHAEKINRNVWLNAPSKNIDQQTFFLFWSTCRRILRIIVNSNYLEAWLYFNLNSSAPLNWVKVFFKHIITFVSGYQCILRTSADAQRKQGKIFIRSLVKKRSALLKDSKTLAVVFRKGTFT